MRTLVLIAIAFAAACEKPTDDPFDGEEVAPPPKQTDPCITLLATNDLHGTLEPRSHGIGDKIVREGGLPILGGYIANARATSKHAVLLLDAGDMYRGSFASDHFGGKPTIAAMNVLAYDAGVLGNHEFDFGSGGGDDVLAVVKQRVADAQFPILAANVFDKATGRRIDWPNIQSSMMKRVGDVDVGIIGISTVETPETTFAKNVEPLEFRPQAPLVEAESKALHAKGAKLIVLIGHVGTECASMEDQKDASSCDASSEMVKLLTGLPKGTVDIAVAGHTHKDVAHWIAGIPTVESNSYARKLGRIDVCVAQAGGVDLDKTVIEKPVALCESTWADGSCGDPKDAPTDVKKATYEGKDVIADARISAILQPYFDEVKELKAAKVGIRLPKPMPRASGDSVGENLVHGMAELASVPMAFQNLGGVRNDLPAGELTFGDIYGVAPFGNHIAILTVNKHQLEETIKALTISRKEPPYTYGFDVKIVGNNVRLLRPNGTPLKPGMYKVATTDFVAMGGDGTDVALKGVTPEILPNAVDRDALMAALRERFPAPLPQRAP